jgi:hypothetical protein
MFAEVTRVHEISPTPLFKLPIIRDLNPLHEGSGVKVPRPASPFMTHETTLGVEMAVAVSRGKQRKNETGNPTYFVVV